MTRDEIAVEIFIRTITTPGTSADVAESAAFAIEAANTIADCIRDENDRELRDKQRRSW